MKYVRLTSESAPGLRSALLAHYERSARDLPWRHDTDPYRVLVSEIMLQQTRVETVLRYYEAWLGRFPTVESVADASEDEVLKAWEGLGYYKRAKNLHRAARVVRDRSDGMLPSTYDGLRELPGVGEYTAGAIASIAFGEPVPAVDGNVRRVLARLFDDPRPKPTWLRDRAAELVEPDRPGDWNQALMELGATICTPRAPDCSACPVARWCAAREAGTQTDRPAPVAKKPVPVARIGLAVLHHDDRLLVERRPAGGMLAGMWAFPERGLPEGEAPRGVSRTVAESLGLRVVSDPRRLDEVRHRFTHLDATYVPEVVEVDGRISEAASRERTRALRWIDPWNDDSTALPVAQRKVLEAWCSLRTSEIA